MCKALEGLDQQVKVMGDQTQFMGDMVKKLSSMATSLATVKQGSMSMRMDTRSMDMDVGVAFSPPYAASRYASGPGPTQRAPPMPTQFGLPKHFGPLPPSTRRLGTIGW